MPGSPSEEEEEEEEEGKLDEEKQEALSSRSRASNVRDSAHVENGARIGSFVKQRSSSLVAHKSTSILGGAASLMRGPGPEPKPLRTIKIVDRLFPRRRFGKQALQTEVLGPVFSKLIIAVITCNCLEIGASCQWPATSGGTLHKVYITFEVVFTIFYCAEALIKMRALGFEGYFKNRTHWFELLIAICGALQVTLALSEPDNIPQIVKTVVKAMSLLRLLRIFRALMFLTNISELAITIGGLMGSFKTLGWVLFVLILIVYAFSVYFVIQVNDQGSMYWCDLLTAMQTMVSVVVLSKWVDILDADDESEFLLLHLPFYAFGLLTVFGVTNIIIGVIVDATSDTKRDLKWSRDRKTLLDVGAMWERLTLEEELNSRGSRQSMGSEASRGSQTSLPTTIDAKLALDSIFEDMFPKAKPDGEMATMFPPGMTKNEFMMLLDYDGDGRISHNEFCTALGRLLLCDDGQLRILALIQQGRTRRQVSQVETDLKTATDRMRKLEDAMTEHMEAMTERMDVVTERMNAVTERVDVVAERVDVGFRQIMDFFENKFEDLRLAPFAQRLCALNT